jgi:uncharacterized protein (TIGR00369 family)
LNTPNDTRLKDLAALQAALSAAPFHRWLGMQVAAVTHDAIELTMPWRDELVSNPVRQTVHGGILASLVDLSGFYALLSTGVAVRATADLRVDYHRAATPGALQTRSRVIKAGRRICVADTEVLDSEGTLLASGRGAYLTA